MTQEMLNNLEKIAIIFKGSGVQRETFEEILDEAVYKNLENYENLEALLQDKLDIDDYISIKNRI